MIIDNAVAAKRFEKRHSPHAAAASGFETCGLMPIQKVLWTPMDQKTHVSHNAVAADKFETGV